jgi:E3 ubiquitin-protein ligase FANCL
MPDPPSGFGHSIAVYQRIIRDFPAIVPDTADLQGFSGFLHVGSDVYRVRANTSSCTRVRGDAALCDILSTCSNDVRQRLANAQDVHALLIELRDVIERVVSRTSASGTSLQSSSLVTAGGGDLPLASYYEVLLRELDIVGWTYVHEMDETMRHIKLSTTDSSNRTHILSVVLPREYPDAPPQVYAALPEQFNLKWSPGVTLASMLDQFRNALRQYEAVFDMLDHLDSHCWILEPEHPIRSDVYRRIALGKHCSLRIELDPRAPTRVIPECRFLGSEAAVGPLRDSLNDNMHLWDTSGKATLAENLERVLGSKLPEPRNPGDPSSQDMGLECGICYSYRFNETVPDVACDRANCAKPFHRSCLAEWLKALPDTRQSFETLFGACPYCEHHISVSFTGV